MQKLKKCSISLLTVFFFLVLIQCSKYKETVPFFDGLLLEYKYTNKNIKRIYKVKVIGSNKFKVIQIMPGRGVLKDDIDEFLVNAYGRVYKSTYKSYKGRFCPIWIPVHKIEIGDTIDDIEIAMRKDKWKKWDVLVLALKRSKKTERYFDLNTGYWVGSKGKTPMGAYEIILVNSNADIPVEED